MNNVIRKNGTIYRDCERSILDWIDNINPADYIDLSRSDAEADDVMVVDITEEKVITLMSTRWYAIKANVDVNIWGVISREDNSVPGSPARLEFGEGLGAEIEVADIFIDGDCDFELGDDFVRGLKDTWVI